MKRRGPYPSEMAEEFARDILHIIQPEEDCGENRAALVDYWYERLAPVMDWA